MNDPFIVRVVTGAPSWQPFTAALVGAIVGGTLALVAGWLASRRTEHIERISRVRHLAARVISQATALVAAASPAPGENRVYPMNENTPIPVATRKAEISYIEAAAEFRWLVAKNKTTNSQIGELNAMLRELVYTSWENDDDHSAHFKKCTAHIESIQKSMYPFAAMPRRRAIRFLAGK